MRLTHDGSVFVFECTFMQKDAAKSAGCRWDPEGKRWYTQDLKVAEKLEKYADERALISLGKIAAQQSAEIKLSALSDIPYLFPVPDGLEYKPYQRAGINYALNHRRSLIADQPGLGKTIQAIGVINALNCKRVLVVCPASLKVNWKNELQKWLINQHSIGIAESKNFPVDCDIVIINYDIVQKNREQIDTIAWDLVIVDEAHYLKNTSAQRTKAVLGGGKERIKPINGNRWIFLTGTPILNQPVELWPIAHFCAPKEFDNFMDYAKKYCDARRVTIKGNEIWDFSGSSNLVELQTLVRSKFMVRRLKSDVLRELPPKIRQIIEVPPDGSFVKIDLEARIAVKKLYEDKVKNLRVITASAIEIMAKLRKEAAMKKLPSVFEIVDNLLDSGQKVAIFAYHHETIDELCKHYSGHCSVIDGRTKNDIRQSEVDRFQNDDRINVFIGSIGAAGVGFTLTAASTVVFVELDWVPGNVSQAEDRLHRIGQDANCVNVLHVVLSGSIDAIMAKKIVKKQSVIDQALDSLVTIEEDTIAEVIKEL